MMKTCLIYIGTWKWNYKGVHLYSMFASLQRLLTSDLASIFSQTVQSRSSAWRLDTFSNSEINSIIIWSDICIFPKVLKTHFKDSIQFLKVICVNIWHHQEQFCFHFLFVGKVLKISVAMAILKRPLDFAAKQDCPSLYNCYHFTL